MKITVSKELKDFAKERAKKLGFSNYNEYICNLIKKEMIKEEVKKTNNI
jgi:hypothetical protein